MVKTNFKSIAECERALYAIGQQVLKGEIDPSQAKAFASICESWIKVKSEEDYEKLINKVDGLEVLLDAHNKKKRRR
jgi:hypothetical protein